METLTPNFSVTNDLAHREVHFVAGGLMKPTDFAEFQQDLLKASKPFLEKKQGFRVLGDLREFPVQDQEITKIMQQSQENSAKMGVEKMAVLYATALQKLQFRRVSAALEFEMFEERESALAWLRS